MRQSQLATGPAMPAPWPGLNPETHTEPSAAEPIAPKKKNTLGFWIALSLLLLAALGFTGMLGWEKINRRIQQLGAERAAKAAVVSKPGAPAARPDPQAEQLQVKITIASLQAEAESLLAMLFGSQSLDERLRAVADPEQHRAEIAALFEGRADPLQMIACVPISNPPLVLGERGRIPTFKVVTSGNRSGALLWLVPAGNGAHRIHWPLFHETHERLLAKFIAERTDEPRWFHVGLCRRHSFDLPEAERGNYNAVDIDGSTDGSGRVLAYIAKQTPLDRHLEPRMGWGQFYFSRVLLGWLDIAGQRRLALLECAGAQAAPSALPPLTQPE